MLAQHTVLKKFYHFLWIQIITIIPPYKFTKSLVECWSIPQIKPRSTSCSSLDQHLDRHLEILIDTCWPLISIDSRSNFDQLSIGVRAPSEFGGGDCLARKNYAMPERVGVEIKMQTQTFTIFPSNETAITGKIAQLKACMLNSVNSLNII